MVVPRRSRAGVAPPSALIFLNEVEARERDVEFGVVRVMQEHEFAVGAFDGYLAQAFELADAVVHVDDKIAGLEIGEIAEEAGGFWARAGALRGRRSVSKRSALP